MPNYYNSEYVRLGWGWDKRLRRPTTHQKQILLGNISVIYCNRQNPSKFRKKEAEIGVEIVLDTVSETDVTEGLGRGIIHAVPVVTLAIK